MKLLGFCWLLLITLSLIILAQAFHLQIIEGKEQWKRSQQNRFRIKTISSQRGIIYDRSGEPLVINQNHQRIYVYKEVFAHVLGYIGEAAGDELSLFGLDSGAWVGKTGLEREEDGILRGIEGGQLEEYSAEGKQVRIFSQKAPITGSNVHIYLDSKLQQYAYQLLEKEKYKGTIIVSTPDGKIVTLVSYPSFDPNSFTLQQKDKIETILSDKDQPMFDRAIAGLYPPGSTFKVVTSLAALESKKIDESTEIEDTGEVRVGDYRYGNWYYDQYGQTDTKVTITKALQRSNDIFFYKVGEKIGIKTLADWASRLGFGKKTKIALAGEERGIVPDPEWKKEALNQDWYLGDTYITAIGQGNLEVTPIQVQMMTGVIANRGYLCQPRLIQSYGDQPKLQSLLSSTELSYCRKLPITEKSIKIIKNGLVAACAPQGTGWPLFELQITNDPTSLALRGTGKLKIDGENFIKSASGSAEMVQIPVACKTGTAETGKFDTDGKTALTHAWFTAFAPAEKPEIVVTVLLEEAGQGSDKAGPLARDIFKKWFEEVRS